MVEDDADTCALRVSDLQPSTRGVISVTPQASLVEAQTKMLVNDYSQLAVMAGTRSLEGAVTWESIAVAVMRRPGARLREALVDATAVGLGDDLLELVPSIVTSGYVFVRDRNSRICGIVTTADLSEVFADRARAFILIGEIDRRLRTLLRHHFTLEELRLAAPRRPGQRELRTFDDLTMGDYQQIVANESMWKRLDWPLDRMIFVGTLSDVRDVRNDVMHFNPVPVDLPKLRALQGMVDILRHFGKPLA